MKIVIDTHTHTVASGHAYSTVLENARSAKAKGLKGIAITDHGPAMEGAPTRSHFSNLKVLPEQIAGVRILCGIEANIIEYDGKLDLAIYDLQKLDFVIASLHEKCIDRVNEKVHTQALLAALKNPYVDAIAHPGNPRFPVDIEEVVKAAKAHGKMLEVNNQSKISRPGSEENCLAFIRLCKKHEVSVICGSDAHYCDMVGNFEHVHQLLKEAEMPEKLVLNASFDLFQKYLKKRQERISIAQQHELF